MSTATLRSSKHSEPEMPNMLSAQCSSITPGRGNVWFYCRTV